MDYFISATNDELVRLYLLVFFIENCQLSLAGNPSLNVTAQKYA